MSDDMAAKSFAKCSTTLFRACCVLGMTYAVGVTVFGMHSLRNFASALSVKRHCFDAGGAAAAAVVAVGAAESAGGDERGGDDDEEEEASSAGGFSVALSGAAMGGFAKPPTPPDPSTPSCGCNMCVVSAMF